MNLDQFSNRKDSFYLFAFMFIVLLVFARSIGYDFFIVDDFRYISNNIKVSKLSLENFLWYWTDANTKTPLFFNFIQLVSAIWGNQNPAVLRLFNIFFHGINAYLVYKIIFKILLKVCRQELVLLGSEKIRLIALLSSLIFSFHPAQVESIVWIYSMRGVLSSLFALISINSYLNFQDRKQNKYLYMVIASYLIGMLFKFNIATIPLAYILIDYFLDDQMTFAQSIARHWLLLSFGICFYFIFSYEYTSEYVSSLRIAPNDSLFIFLRTSLHYLVKLFVPANYNLDYGLNYDNYKNFMPNVWFNRLGILSVILLNMYALKSLLGNNKNLYIFCFLLFLVFMFPGLGMIPHDFQYASFVSDRYLYLGVVALALLMALLTVKLCTYSLKIAQYFIGTILVIFLLISLGLIQTWSDTGELLVKSYRANSNSQLVYESMLTYYDQKNKLEKIRALIWFDTRKMIKNRQSFLKLIGYLGKNNRVNDALIIIESWKNQGNDFVELLYLQLYLEAQLSSAAEKQFEKVAKLSPEILKKCNLNLVELRQRLEKLKSEAPEKFSTWEQLTRQKYKPISEHLNTEMIKRKYPLDWQASGSEVPTKDPAKFIDSQKPLP